MRKLNREQLNLEWFKRSLESEKDFFGKTTEDIISNIKDAEGYLRDVTKEYERPKFDKNENKTKYVQVYDFKYAEEKNLLKYSSEWAMEI